ncbi:MAG: circularly permuted type 2 ATP-grasp protein [Alphaproteobacteria bacterium]|nr:circularly permuted type 2 ATP-grasp protein [Alphaproteobacteria bacterium]
MTSSVEPAVTGAAAPRRASAAWDEMVTGQGRVRPAWQPLFAVLSEIGAAGIAARGERVRQQLEDDGITFNLYDPAEERRGRAAPARARPWVLDPLPLILAADEWAMIERGVVQRARLLDRVLADLYGPQRLLADRRYPPALVYGNPEFLRACRRRDAVPPGFFVQHYAADLARGPDGVWRVVGDRLQAPAGAAFAHHHRRVMARVMGEALRASRVRPLAGFFDGWTADLQARAASDRDNPCIAVLTPGPFNEAYVEHVSLARELGATLVEGSDLTARDGRIYLKTLGGLQQVDTILRRVDGAWCDPLELRADSGLGVVGLVDAARAGGVSVVNALGSGLVDAPALAAFLPRLAEHMLGEGLALPSIASWWCGERYACDAALERLESVALRSATAPGDRPVNGDELDAAARAAAIARVKADPGAYMAQERIVASLAPGQGTQGLQPQPVVLRVFATAVGGDYVVMPGGLARVPAGDDPLRVGLQQGGVNKDVWVVADDPTTTIVPARVAQPAIVIRRSLGELPSRSADDLFWLGRNVERLENGGRLLRAGLQRLVSGLAGARDIVEMATVMRVLARCGIVDLNLAAAPPDGPAVRHALIHAFAGGGLLDGALTAIERLAAASRDRFSVDMRRTLNHLLGELRGRLARFDGDPDRLLDLLDELVRLSAALAGLASENMTRGSGWRFLDLGRRIERGIYVARVVLGVGAIPTATWEAALRLALELCDSTITYRMRYLAALLDAPVLDLVVVDPSNPQSLGFQIAAIAGHLAALPIAPGAPDGRAASEAMRSLETIVTGLSAQARPMAPATLAGLRAALSAEERALMALSDSLTRAYFSHVPAARVVGAA